MKSLIKGLCILLSVCLNLKASANAVNCPPTILNASSDPGVCGAQLTVPGPTEIDPDCTFTVVNDFNNTDDASGFYPVGTTDVIFTATFTDGTTQQCVIEVIVVDQEDPNLFTTVNTTFFCEENDLPPPYASLAEFLADGNTASDNCGLDASTFMFIGQTSNGETCQEIITRMYAISDINTPPNSATINQNFFVNDTIAPIVTCPMDFIIDTDPDQCGTNVMIPLVVSDNCGTAEITFEITGTTTVADTADASGFYAPGTYTVTYFAQDSCANADTCMFTFTVFDNDPPFISILDPIDTISCDADLAPTQIPTLVDNCDPDPVVTIDTFFTINTCQGYDINYVYTAIDSSGNSMMDTVSYHVRADDQAPTLDAAPDKTPRSITCGAPFPEPDTDLTATDNCSPDGTGQAEVVFEMIIPDNIDVCAGYEVIYRYFPIDTCGNIGDTTDMTFMVLPDQEAPEFDPDPIPDFVFNITTDVCEADLTGLIPDPMAEDSCTNSISFSYVQTVSGIFDPIFPLDTTEITWTATDSCGNTATRTQDIIVIDAVPPTLTCQDSLQVMLGGGVAKIGADQIILSADDNCDVDSISIRRMADNCMIPDDLMAGDSISVCCADIPSIMIVAEVTDVNGNKATCMVDLLVGEVIPPTATCPTSITVSCDLDIDLNDLSQFGTVVSDGASVMTYTVEGQSIEDGLADDNCAIDTITVAVVDNRDTCGEGDILRTFTVIDESNNSATCTQTITVANQTPFTEDNITWPDDVTIPGCGSADFSIEANGVPTVDQINCSQIMINESADLFDYPNEGCPFMHRTWTIIDWCQYDPNVPDSPGRWEHLQKITVEDNTLPTITLLSSQTVCFNNGSCSEGNANQQISVADECTPSDLIEVSWSVDLGNDGLLDYTGTGLSIENILPAGEHKIKWKADDRCGNQTPLEYVVTVEDCKPPSPVCIYGLAINLVEMPNNVQMATIWAKDFDASSFDNCTDTDDLVFSLSADTTVTSITFSCFDVGPQPIEMWVTDSNGNQAYCTTYIEVQDNHNLCPELIQELVSLGGKIQTPLGEPMANVNVNVSSTDMEQTYLTDAGGFYMFPNLDHGNNYQIKPAYEDQYIRRGISTLDIILIQRHILNLQHLDSPYKVIAADADGSKSLSAADIVEIRKFILELYDTYPDNDLWQFVNGSNTFPDIFYPWNFDNYTTLIDVTEDNMYANFYMMKTGDVNESYTADMLGQDSELRGPEVILDIEEEKTQNGWEYTFSIDREENLSGFQIKLSADNLGAITVTSDHLELTSDNYYADAHALAISWHSKSSILVKSELFSVITDSPVNWKLTDQFDSELYDSELTVNQIQLGESTSVTHDQILTAIPNPFKGSTVLTYDQAQAGEATLLVYNEIGELIYGAREIKSKGKNTFTIDEQDLEGSGVYFCQIVTETKSYSEKILLIK